MKSFSEITKAELFKKKNEESCCDNAEFAGMLLFGSDIKAEKIRFVTENELVLDRYIELAKKAGVGAEGKRISSRYVATVENKNDIEGVLNNMELIDLSTNIIRYRISPLIINRDCCRRAFIRGAFMGGGTVIDPNKNYNLEIITQYLGLCDDFVNLLSDEGFEFKTVVRKSKYVIYTKKSEVIEDFLTYMGAFSAQMSLINVKIEKEVRNGFNRSINGENANYDKIILASVNQIHAIEYIKSKNREDLLTAELRDIAELRLKNKDMSLVALGQLLNPPLGKSGVNHRLKKIIDIAERLSEEYEE